MTEFKPQDTSPIALYMHCMRCLAELPKGESPASFSRTQTGVTAEGEVIVWCIRHDDLVANLGQTSRLVSVKCGCAACAAKPS